MHLIVLKFLCNFLQVSVAVLSFVLGPNIVFGVVDLVPLPQDLCKDP